MAKWQKGGPSPNPNGRPAGLGKSELLRKAIADKLPDIIDKLVASALNGDTAAAKILVDRGIAPLRAKDTPVNIGPLPLNLGESAMTILQVVAEGKITPLQGQQMLAGLGNVARAIETDELMRRIERLEKGENEQSADPN
jgi:hypothetical protein